MATFKTEKEAQKWKQLSRSISVPIENISSGKAKPEDLKAIKSVLTKYDELAASLFEDSVKTASDMAHTVTSSLNDARVNKGKKPLTDKAQSRLYEASFKKLLQNSSKTIVEDLELHFSLQLDDAVADISDVVENAFSKVNSLVRGSKDDGFKNWKKYGGEGTSSRAPSIKDVMDLVQTKNDYALTVVDNKQKSSATPVNAIQTLTNRHGDTFDLLDPEEASSTSLAKVHNPNTTDNAMSKLDLILSILNQLTERDTSDKKVRRVQQPQPQEENKRATSWVKKIKDFFVSSNDWIVKKYRKVRNKFRDYSNFAESLTAPLMALLMAPDLFNAIGTKIGEVLNINTITSMLDSALTSLKGTAMEGVDWVVTKIKSWLDSDDTPEKKKQKQAESAARSKTGGFQPTFGAPAKTAKAANTITTPMSLVKPTSGPVADRDERELSHLNSLLSDAKTAAANQTASGQPVSPGVSNTLNTLPKQIEMVKARIANKKQTTSSTGAASSSVGASTTVSSEGAPNVSTSSGGTQTSVKSAVVPMESKGLVLDIPPLPDAEAKQKTGNRQTAAGNSISLSSFGMRPGDDSLFMMNLGIA